jgi:hypothetical protein
MTQRDEWCLPALTASGLQFGRRGRRERRVALCESPHDPVPFNGGVP